MVLKIVHYNDSVLRTKGAPVTSFDADLALLARDMVETMHAAAGIGLAAQQIGKAIQFCVVDLARTDRDFDWLLDGAAGGAAPTAAVAGTLVILGTTTASPGLGPFSG